MANKKWWGIPFRINDDAGIAHVTLENKDTSEIILDELIDLWSADFDATADEYGVCTIWLLGDDEADYEITILHGGHDDVAHTYSIGNYAVEYEDFIESIDYINARIQKKLYVYHTDHSDDIFEFDIINGQTTNLEKIQEFTADGTTTEFTLSGINHAQELLQVSSDAGVTWLETYDVTFTFGSNETWDNETIDNNGYVTVSFLTAPTENVMLKYVPKANKAYIKHKFLQNNYEGVYEKRMSSKLIDYGIEFIK